MPAPHRRHRFMLSLEADTLDDLVGVLHFLADEIEAEGRQDRRLTYRGTASTYDARLRTDPEQDCAKYREQLAQWYRDQDRSATSRHPLDSLPWVCGPTVCATAETDPALGGALSAAQPPDAT